MDRGADGTPLDLEIVGTPVPGDEQQKAVPARNGLVERSIGTAGTEGARTGRPS